MKLARIRYLLIVFAAIFLANNAVAAARACMVELATQAHSAIQTLDTSGDAHRCLDADRTANCLAHCTQSYKNDERKFSFDAPPFVIAPAPSPHRAWFRAEPRLLVIASAPPVVGPSLTILFGNFRK
ncbi:MAG: hypothetical protein A2W18_09640 [Candidatus Muproteobacteria bacterium RBG_16_60_9]|uniref:Uncharacterized protein n=1 Tax=Candidatus Muproteobacteria bacterium RBG_16_60_9 TaxID=1817755 RepID=A0A1F6VDT2_9PROT|nr:MAG: hypothetical protein A2W18_09640 [Candidatus Muproteobacteria bacterium RBG_16_60_9]